jgi:Domain of unknown function (DUF397)
MSSDATPATGWRKSSRCGAGGSCVEVAVGQAAVGMRDSKLENSPVLTFTAAAWRGFLSDVRAGRFDAGGS